MSRIGKKPINIPDGVDVKIDDGLILIKGPRGELSQTIPSKIGVSVKEISEEDSEKKRKEIQAKPVKKVKNINAIWGLTRALIANMVKGVTEGFKKELIIEGVGFRAALEGKNLVLNLGLSHPVKLEAPEGIEFSIDKNVILVSGIDKQLVGQIAAKIRDQKKPEPYKGKGIRYIDEVIRRKAGKKAVGAE